MRLVEDRYGGVIVDPETFPQSCSHFESELKSILSGLKTKKLIWIKIPSEHSKFIPIVTELGFDFHHCAGNSLMLVKKLCSNPVIPNAKNYNLGIGAVVQRGELLLAVKDRFSKGYKLPGGLVEPKETIGEALVREVFEETGIHTEFESIINVGHFMNGQFGEQNLYFVGVASAKTTEIKVHDSSEIIDAQWVDTMDFLNSDDVNAYYKEVVNTVYTGSHSTLIKKNVALKTTGEIFL